MNDLAWEPDAPSAAQAHPCPTISLPFVQTSPPQWEQCGHSSGCDLSVAYLPADAKSSSHEVIYIAPTLYSGPCDNNRLSWSRYFESILCCYCTSASWFEPRGKEGILKKTPGAGIPPGLSDVGRDLGICHFISRTLFILYGHSWDSVQSLTTVPSFALLATSSYVRQETRHFGNFWLTDGCNELGFVFV